MGVRGKRVARTIFAVIGCAMLAGGAWAACEWHKQATLVRRGWTEAILTMDADLTRPGRYSGTLDNFLPSAHEIRFYATGSPELDSSDEDVSYAAIEGLACELTLTDSAGNRVAETPIESSDAYFIQGSDVEQRLILTDKIKPRDAGRYGVTVDVKRGAAGCQGRPMGIGARYLLCGMEELPVAVLLLLTAGLFLGGLGSGVVCLWMTRRIRRAGRETPAEKA
jgi:hypothetical protein